MAKITRIKASDGPAKDEVAEAEVVRKKVVSHDKKDDAAKAKQVRKAEKREKAAAKKDANGGKKPFILFRPFVAFGRYLRDSWKELRQVRWPNRKATWQMLVAVLVYTAIFIIAISLLDLFFQWLFKLILG